ncbi:ATPase GET3B-like isoform X2 [Henckelia pumila]|uniref:ATPase GET3B-like isoform X2 n=1 Tax=Henckelia pumila TaxID=405737 RepID=UPI003C6E3AD9
MASCPFATNSIANYASLKPMAIMVSYYYRHSHLFKTPRLASFSKFKSSGSSSFVTISIAGKMPRGNFQVRSVAAPTESVAGFDEMVSGTQRKYYMLGGKGGVGKTSCAASLAVKFANNGHPTLVVSTDPAHSLSDSFAQDLTGGTLVPVEGPISPLFALEINPEKAREEFRNVSQKNGGSGVKDFMDGMGLGIIADQVIQFLESAEYNMFTRIVFDTAPTGHTLRLLSLPDFLDASIGKILKLRQKITSATSAIKSLFVQEENRQDAADKLEKLRERMIKVRELFRDTNSTEFVIVTIPTVMAISESSRLCASLKKESVPVKRLVVNQILPPSASDCKFCAMKRKDQTRALGIIQNDPELSSLKLVQAPLVDVEIRGVPALQFLGEAVWK